METSLKWIEDNAHMAISLSTAVFSVINTELENTASRDQRDKTDAVPFAAELPLLKNGSTLRNKTAKTVNNNIIVSNTCAFDTVSSILMTAYKDSDDYRNNVNNCNDSTLLQFVNELANFGITDKTYSIRAVLLVRVLFIIINIIRELKVIFVL